MFKSSNDGLQWENFGQGLPFLTEISDLTVFNNKILTATSDGIYQRNASEVTGINIISNEVPSGFSLSQNYPNPFNPNTHFEFRIADFGFVKLMVFDALGREVAALVNKEIKPGIYEVNWDASNYPSGVYYYKLETGEYKETKKMILIK